MVLNLINSEITKMKKYQPSFLLITSKEQELLYVLINEED
jgi:hypothetical protein